MKTKTTKTICQIIAVLLLYTGSAMAQNKNTGFYGNQKNLKIKPQFRATKGKSVKEIESLISQIVKQVGMTRNFKVIENPGSEDCLAQMVGKDNNEQPAIVYDPLFLEQFRSGFNFTKGRISDKQKMDWIALSILAHEVGHIINQHLSNDVIQQTKSSQTLELEADVFSGLILCRLGATLKQAQAAMYSPLVPLEVSRWDSHPDRRKRLAAIERGFKEAGCDLIPEGMVLVEGGSFMMGCVEGDSDCQGDEKPRHEVILDDFYMGKYEVTVGEYLKFAKATNSHYPEWLREGNEYNIHTGTEDHYKKLGNALTAENHPIVGVSWHDAVAYCKWLSQKTGINYRLPTEAEWEYAARSRGKNEKWSGTSSKSSLANYGNYYDSGEKDGYKRTAPVGRFSPNDLGIYDMSGNVWEWCSDWYDSDYYETSSKYNPKGISSGTRRVLRGGGWFCIPFYCRTSKRPSNNPDISNNYGGFRLAHSSK